MSEYVCQSVCVKRAWANKRLNLVSNHAIHVEKCARTAHIYLYIILNATLPSYYSPLWFLFLSLSLFLFCLHATALSLHRHRTAYSVLFLFYHFILVAGLVGTFQCGYEEYWVSLYIYSIGRLFINNLCVDWVCNMNSAKEHTHTQTPYKWPEHSKIWIHKEKNEHWAHQTPNIDWVRAHREDEIKLHKKTTFNHLCAC